MRFPVLTGFLLLLIIAAPAQAAGFIALCYHDVQDVVTDPDGMAVSRDNLVAQFSWLRENGFRPVGLEDLQAAQRGERPLPEKAVLLTFDDGYASFYSKVFPLLKAFEYPAVLALVGSWLEVPPGGQVAYGDRQVSRERFMTWEQIREVATSNLVELASHSYDMHKGVPANPQGNEQPAMTTRRYSAASGEYESDAAYAARLQEDFARNSALFEKNLGVRPQVMTWPYGAYNRPAQTLAAEHGMPITLNLEVGANDSGDLSAVRRVLILNNPSLADFVWQMRHPLWERPRPIRVVHIDLDYVYDPDPVQQEANLGQLLERIQKLGVNTVYLQAFADPDADGVADALYFPNRHLPVRADLFNRAAWQLRTRTGVKVYAWLPVLAFNLGDQADLVQRRSPQGKVAPDPDRYRRLSPFSASALRLVGEIYEDLAKHAAFNGLLFHDDAVLSDFEDAHPQALAAYREAGLPADVGRLRAAAPSVQRRWTRLKIQALDDFTLRLAERARTWRPAIKTARNLFALPVLERASESWFAQSLPRFLEHYDYTALMAMPWMEGAADPEAWLEKLALRVAQTPGALSRVVFELQSVDWRRGNAPIPGARLAAQMRALARLGVKHYGYYPDDFIKNHPRVQDLQPVMSLRTFPYVP